MSGNKFLSAALFETGLPDTLMRGLIGICLTAPGDGVNKSAEYWADIFMGGESAFPVSGLFDLKSLGLIDVGVGDGFYAILKVKRGRLVGQTELKRPAIPKAIKDHVMARDGQSCTYCGCENGPFHFDHVRPWSRGGKHTVKNLVVACVTCNLAKGARTPKEMGWNLG